MLPRITGISSKSIYLCKILETTEVINGKKIKE
jgi:hypothetical protein